MAGEVTYKHYTEARSEAWKRVFVFAISQYMTTVAQPGEEAPYLLRRLQRCLTNSKDVVLVRHVEAYVARNPVNSNEPMVRIVMKSCPICVGRKLKRQNRPGRNDARLA